MAMAIFVVTKGFCEQAGSRREYWIVRDGGGGVGIGVLLHDGLGFWFSSAWNKCV